MQNVSNNFRMDKLEKRASQKEMSWWYKGDKALNHAERTGCSTTSVSWNHNKLEMLHRQRSGQLTVRWDDGGTQRSGGIMEVPKDQMGLWRYPKIGGMMETPKDLMGWWKVVNHSFTIIAQALFHKHFQANLPGNDLQCNFIFWRRILQQCTNSRAPTKIPQIMEDCL